MAVVLWLVIGAVINVGVAWGTYWFDPDPQPDVPVSTVAGWPGPIRSGWPGHPDERSVASSIWCDNHNATAATSNPFHAYGMYCCCVGVPIRCVKGYLFGGDREPMELSKRAVGLWFPNPAVRPRPLGFPFLPVWPGFAINTLFYAAIAWGLWLIPPAIRRRLRRRAGKCVKCGYDRRGLPEGAPCPECAGPAAGV